jgi:SAM-dependent methyltransferase
MGTDQIFLGASMLSDSPKLRIEALDGLNGIVASRDYQEWQNGPLQIRPFSVAAGFDRGALRELGVLADGVLKVRINVVRGNVMLTDGVWVDPQTRVFPFHDESAAISRYCVRRGLAEWSDVVIDLATGSGHNLAYFNSGVRGIGLDINPRALSYFHLNNVLNDNKKRVGVLNDIRGGFSDLVSLAEGSRILVLSNLPFGLAPTSKMLALTSNGGENGLQLQQAALSAIARFRKTARGAASRSVMLGYSLGNAAAGQWELVELAESTLGDADIRFSILHDEGLLRVDGRRTMANPSPLYPALHAAGACSLYHLDARQAQARYQELADKCIAHGVTDLAYLAIEIQSATER